MAHITLIFPDQLFQQHPGIASNRPIYLAEEFLFYKIQPFHKQRLILLRASMRAYAERLIKDGKEVIYIPSKDLNHRGALFNILAAKQIKNVHLAEFADEWLKQDLAAAAKKHDWNIHFYPSPGFICSNKDINAFFAGKEHFSMAQFYAYQRKRLGILMKDRSPIGGKYSFDVENRKKIPKGFPLPHVYIPPGNQYVEDAIADIETEFPDAIGQGNPFLYPVNYEQANAALSIFLKEKFKYYGDYQDAIDSTESTLFHSVLSSSLNIGLITPLEIASVALNYAQAHSVPLNCLEGFLRQIIGWREFVRASYLLKGSNQRSGNFFNHQEKIPLKFWKGSVGILPIDTVIRRVIKTGYCNHIERLMLLGNFLLLTESSPDEVYRWFMGHFVDAFDWVMVPNVYGMSQYADGGSIVTKPYIGASNYVLKMSHYSKGEWTEIWDGLFWRFLNMHRSFFSANYRIKTLIQLLSKNENSILPKIRKAETWLNIYRNDDLK